MFSLLLINRLNDWCESRSLFNEYQFGFRDGFGFIPQLTVFIY